MEADSASTVKGRSRSAKWLVRIAAIGIALAAGVWVPRLIYIPLISDSGCCDRFNETVWKSPANRRCAHGHMVNDLEHRLTRARLTKAQVLTLLGPESRNLAPSDLKLVYALGFCDIGIFNIDLDFIEIHFDDQGRFSRIRRYQG